MRLPQFTGESALGRTVTSYTNASFSSVRHGTGSVIAQITHLCPPWCAHVCWPPDCLRRGGCEYCRCECPPNFA